MKIKYVKYPIPSSKSCTGAYVHESKTIIVGKNSNNKTETIVHEFGHYIIDLIGIVPVIKHHLNLFYDILWVVFDYDRTIKAKRKSIKWYIKYYSKFARRHEWVY